MCANNRCILQKSLSILKTRIDIYIIIIACSRLTTHVSIFFFFFFSALNSFYFRFSIYPCVCVCVKNPFVRLHLLPVDHKAITNFEKMTFLPRTYQDTRSPLSVFKTPTIQANDCVCRLNFFYEWETFINRKTFKIKLEEMPTVDG